VLRKGSKVQRLELGAAAPIEKAVEAWRRRVADSASGTVDEKAAGLLHRNVWLPLEKAVDGARTVLVVPDVVIGAQKRFSRTCGDGRAPHCGPFRSLRVEDPDRQQLEPSAAVHLPLDDFQPIDLPLHRPVAPPRRQRCRHRRLVLAQPFRETADLGATGLGDRAGEAVLALLPSLYEAAHRHGLYVAVVVPHQAAFAAAQAARSKLLHDDKVSVDKVWPVELTEEHRDKAKKLADLASRGKLALFLGAGVSGGAGISPWGRLLARLAERAGMADECQEIRDLNLSISLAPPRPGQPRTGPCTGGLRHRLPRLAVPRWFPILAGGGTAMKRDAFLGQFDRLNVCSRAS
jgi:hypothetical protein